jgi:hypothetical protein
MKSVSKRGTEDKDLLKEIELLRDAVVDGPITSDWDPFLRDLSRAGMEQCLDKMAAMFAE